VCACNLRLKTLPNNTPKPVKPPKTIVLAFSLLIGLAAMLKLWRAESLDFTNQASFSHSLPVVTQSEQESIAGAETQFPGKGTAGSPNASIAPTAARGSVGYLPKDVAARLATQVSGKRNADFLNWANAYLSADPAKREALQDEGLRLAEARRDEFRLLIKSNPARAIADAVPMVVRQALPEEIVKRLEKRPNGVAVIRVIQAAPMPGEEVTPETGIFREVEFQNGPTYRAYVYGRRAETVLWTPNASVNGVAIGSDLAVNESPSRRLEVGEVPSSTKPKVTVCPVSGDKTAAAEAPAEPLPEGAAAVETAREVVNLCGIIHIEPYNQALIMGEGVTGGAYGFTGILPAAPTPSLGAIKVLAIPMTYADQNGVPSTEEALYRTLNQVGSFYAQSSYGRLSLIGTVSPPIKLPHTEAWYVNRDTSNGGDISGTTLEHHHARAEARKLGFDDAEFDCVVVRHNGGPGSYGGLGGGSSVWVRGDSTALWAHEIGHCFGLPHANFWNTSGISAIGAGTNSEYGDPFDVMGSGNTPGGHYNAQAKAQIKWLESSFIEPISQSGQYRIHAFDQGGLAPGKTYAFSIVKDPLKTYWMELRSLYDSNPWVKNGVLLGWNYPNGSGSNIQRIDTTTGSPFGKEDAPISVGATFSDWEAGIHITTVAVNENPRFADVVVNFGTFSDNGPPTLTLNASGTNVPAGATVTFTASASDPDGDSLAYSWQHFGDSSFKTVFANTPSITRTFSTDGAYVVACTVSDMRGGVTTRNCLVTVGSGGANKYTLSGRVSSQGNGIRGIPLTANGSNAVFTDADGYFVFTNLPAATYAISPLSDAFSFSEKFNNSVTIGPSFAGANFEATSLPIVSIQATIPFANEGAPVTAGKITISRTGDTSLPLSVNIPPFTGTASSAADYFLSPSATTGSQGFLSFTIPAGSSTLDVFVTPKIDSLAESVETVTIQIGPGNGYRIGPQSAATVQVLDDDTALPVVGITASKLSTAEGSGQPAVLTVQRRGSTASSLTIAYSVSGTATPGADYTALPSSVEIPAGALSQTILLQSIDDAIAEAPETVIFTLGSSGSYLADSSAKTVTLRILDDDAPVVTIEATKATATEVNLSQPNATPDVGTFVVKRTGDVSQALTVYYSVSGRDDTGSVAMMGADFEPLPGSVVIPAGSTSASVTVIPRYDQIIEGPESVVISIGASPLYTVSTVNSATLTINDASGDLPYVSVINISSAAEPTNYGVFQLTVKGGSGVLTVPYSLSGSATVDVDYQITGAGNTKTETSITLSGGVVTKNIVVTPISDSLPEDLESITLTLPLSSTYRTFAPTSSATMWLRDNGQPTVYVDAQVGAYSSVSSTIEEVDGKEARFYVSRTSPTTSALLVRYTIGGSATPGVDYTALTGSITIEAGQTGAYVPVSVVDDSIFEGTETITFDFAAGAYSRGPGTVMYLADNETSSQTVAFVSAGSSGSESIGSVDIPVVLSAPASGRITVEYEVSSGNRSSKIENASASNPAWLKLERNGDAFSAATSADGVAWINVGSVRTIPLPQSLMIGLALSSKQSFSLQTGTVQSTLLNGAPIANLKGRTIGFAGVDGSYQFSGATHIIAGAGKGIGGNDDHCYFASTEVSGNFSIVTPINSQSVTQLGLMVREGTDYRGRMVYLGVLNKTSVEFISRSFPSSSATGSGVDYTLASGLLTFEAGDSLKNIRLTITDDNAIETSENVVFTLKNAYGAILRNNTQFTYSILDNDTASSLPIVHFAAATGSAAEAAGSSAILVSLSRPSSSDVTVAFSVTGGTASRGSDFSLADGSLTFAPGQTISTIPLTLIDDLLVEPSETVVVSLANPQGASLGTLKTHTQTINDDDLPTVSITATSATAYETGAAGAFTVSRTGPTTASLTVNYARSGTAANGSDYTSIPSSAIVIPAGQSSVVVNISPLQDSAIEGAETVTLSLTLSSAYVLGTAKTATVTILDDDLNTVSITADRPNASETPGNSGRFTVSRTGSLASSLSVRLSAQGSANEGLDYTTVPATIGLIVFAAGESSKTIDILPIDDALIEGTEYVVVSVVQNGYDLGASPYASVTLADNDAAPMVMITKPGSQGTLIDGESSLLLEAAVAQGSDTKPLTLEWTAVSGPGPVVFETANASSTGATFSQPGAYVLRINATDGTFASSDQITVIVGGAGSASDWIAQDLGPNASARGESLSVGATIGITGSGAGYAERTSDQAHLLSRAVDGDASIAARLSAFDRGDLSQAASIIAGITMRDVVAADSRRAVLGFSPDYGLQFRTRTTAATGDTVTTIPGITLPVWLKLQRNSSTDEVTAFYAAADLDGNPVSWMPIGSAVVVKQGIRSNVGLTATSGISGKKVSATFDQVTISPPSTVTAFVSEDAKSVPTASGSATLSNGTHTVSGSSSGYFHGWQFAGDFMVTAKHVDATSGAGSATSGLRISENLESGAFAHLGRIPTSSYNGFYWRGLIGASTSGVPSFTAATRWIRMIRRGNSITGFHAADSGGKPGTWSQLGQPQTVIMSTSVMVGFWVDNASGIGLNTATFSDFSVVPLNSGPSIKITGLAPNQPSPVAISASVTDDNNPSGTVSSVWTKRSGPGLVTFNDPASVNVVATFLEPGTYVLRLTANDGEVQTFKDITLNIPNQGPSIISPLSAIGLVGSPFEYQIGTNKVATSYTCSDLPLGLSFDPVAGLIWGTPAAPWSGNVKLGASNSEGYGTATLSLVIGGKPAITAQPQNSMAVAGSRVVLSVLTDDSGPVNYQWRKEGVAISGGTQAQLVFDPLQAANEGSYDVILTNAFGSTTSVSATVSVLFAPSITAQPVGGTFNLGMQLVLSVGVSGTAPFSYQWRKNGLPIESATQSTLSIAQLQPSDSGLYDVRISSILGTVTSALATVSVNSPATVAQISPSRNANWGESVPLEGKAAGTAPFAYQWYSGVSGNTASPVVGATTEKWSAPALLSPVAFYWLRISNLLGSDDSPTITITHRDTQPPAISPLANISLPAVDAKGAVVHYASATATDEFSPTTTITYSTPSGSLFPLGSTPVTVSAKDEAGNVATRSFSVTVFDDAKPVLNLPKNFIADATTSYGGLVSYPPGLATDNVTAEPTLSFSHPNGSFLPLGRTTVSVTASDAAGNTTSGTFDVTVADISPPKLTLPGDITVPTSNAAGVKVTYPPATAKDNVTPNPRFTYSKASNTLFPIGITTVIVTASDIAGNTSSGSFKVAVVDVVPPVLTLPPSLTLDAGSPAGTFAAYPPATAVDNITPNPTITYSHASGSFFPLGRTTVSVTASDAAGNTTAGTFDVTVADLSAPKLTLPEDITVPTTNIAGGIVKYPLAKATDNVTPNPVITYSKASDSLFPMGITTVTVSAKDEAGNTSSGSFKVAVVDVARPVLTLPANIIVDTSNASGTVVTYPPASATDEISASPVLTYSKPSGSIFPIGTTTVYVSATDDAGNMSTGYFMVTVKLTLGRPQSIAFEAIPNGVATTKLLPLNVTTSSQLPVTIEVLSGPATLAADGGALIISGSGLVSVRASQPGDATYGAAQPVTQNFTVQKLPESQQITFAPLSRITYGAAPLNLSASASSGLPVTFKVEAGPGQLGTDGKSLLITGAGQIAISAMQPGNVDFLPASPVTKTLSVSKKLLSVVPRDVARAVGLTNPSFQIRYEGFVGSDDESVLDKKPLASSMATFSSPVGNYPISVSGAADANYAFAYKTGKLTVRGLRGAYEALLFDESGAASGKLEVSTTTGSSYSGKLILPGETTVLRISGALAYGHDMAGASSSSFWVREAKAGLPRLEIPIEWTGDSILATVIQNGVRTHSSKTTGRRLYAPVPNSAAPWTGNYTLLITNPVPFPKTSETYPMGSGYASVSVAPATGLMTLYGKLADGKLWSSTASPDPAGAYRVIAKPYGARTHSYISGLLELIPHPDAVSFPNRFHVSQQSGRFVWAKAPATGRVPDAVYAQGFGPLELKVSLDPWLAPSRATQFTPARTLLDRLKLSASVPEVGEFGVDFGERPVDMGVSGRDLPSALKMDAKGLISVNAAFNPCKWSMKVDAATGVFSGKFVLTDPAQDGETLPIQTVGFSGIFRQGQGEALGLGGGFLIIDVIEESVIKKVSGELRLKRGEYGLGPENWTATTVSSAVNP
jgi:hypothetical protein